MGTWRATVPLVERLKGQGLPIICRHVSFVANLKPSTPITAESLLGMIIYLMYFCTTVCEPKADVLDPDLPAGCTAAAQVFQVKVIEGLVSTSVYVVHSNSILGEGDEVVCNVVSTGLMICIRHGSYHKICLVLVQDIRRVLVCSIN